MEAECSDDVMKLRIKFNATFAGLIYSAGKASQNAATAINCNFRHSEYLLQVSLFMFQKYHSHSFKTLIVHSLQNPLSSSGNMLLLQLVSVFFSGYSYDNDCIYINGTGEDEYEFYIQLNRCGTLGGSDHNKKRNAPGYKNTDPTVSDYYSTTLR